MQPLLDQNDRKILQHLQNNAEITVEALSERVNLSRNACWRRVKLLEEAGFIRKRVALLSARHIGVGQTVFVQIRVKEHASRWLERFRAAIADFPEITSAFRMSGDLDYLLAVQVADVPSYDSFYQRFIARVDGADISASFVMEEIKNTTELPI